MRIDGHDSTQDSNLSSAKIFPLGHPCVAKTAAVWLLQPRIVYSSVATGTDADLLMYNMRADWSCAGIFEGVHKPKHHIGHMLTTSTLGVTAHDLNFCQTNPHEHCHC